MRVRTVRSWGVAVLAGGMTLTGAGAVAQSNSAVPDAQVEANVLRALAGAPALSNQNIQSTTVYGVVTLRGNVHDDTLRTQAENLAARADGVKKVVDELTLGDVAADNSGPGGPPQDAQGPPPGQVLQSDGTYAPSPADDGGASAQQADSNQPYPPQGQQYPPQQGQYPQQGPPPQGRQPMYGNGYAPGPEVPGGQRAGLDVTVPAGSMLRIRINRGLDSQHIQPGAVFDGTVLTDIVAGGAVAIPRGATVQGRVVDSKKAGALKGQGELSLQITNLTLGGNMYPLATEVWQREGKDKTAGTVNRAIGLGVLGALVGAAAGGGSGAAIGAGVGGAAGVASSAGSPRGQIIIPPESVLTFRIADPLPLKTVSEQEMARLSYAAGSPQQPQRPMRRYYSPYYGYYYGPGQ